jgi:hypothetical protein
MSDLSENHWAPRRYRAHDRAELALVLAPDLEKLYPGGSSWLCGRLDDIEAGRARAMVVARPGALYGVAIETPKEPGRVKLSTLWVVAGQRRLGVGSSLLRRCRRGWLAAEVERVDVTCATVVGPALAPLLHASGFSLERVDRDRYGEGRHEMVYSWFAEADLEAPGRPKLRAPTPPPCK